MIKIALLYTRSSEAEQYQQTYATEQQFRELFSYCSSKNIAVLQCFRDIHNGTDFERSGFLQMLEYVEKFHSNIDYILFTKRDRFSYQNAHESNEMIGKLMAKEIEPKPLFDPYFMESNTPQQMQDFFNFYKQKHT